MTRNVMTSAIEVDLLKKLLLAIFHTFTRGTNDLCLSFVKKYEKSKKIDPPYCVLISNPATGNHLAIRN
jgi:hypothetical protein